METSHEQFLRIQKEIEEKQYNEIITKPNLTPIELWTLTEKNFHEWRKKYDYPILLKSLNEKYSNFATWKSEFNISDEMIIECSLSDFIGPKKLSKQKYLYLLEQTFDGKKRLLVAYSDLTGIKPAFPDHTESYILICRFLSFSDWCKLKKIKDNLFDIKTRQAPGYDSEKVWIDSGYELLKMGGISAPKNAFGVLLRGKHLEFVNLCGLSLEGSISFGEEGNLSLSYCAGDNILCKNLEIALIDFEYSSLTNLQIVDSKIQQWRFWECNVTGDVVNSKLTFIEIFGGHFTPIFKDTTLLEVDAVHKGHPITNFHTTYSTLKKIYSDQGDDFKAKEYFFKEKDLSREFSKGWRYLVKTTSRYFWGYGRKPQQIIYFSIGLIFLCSIVYYFYPNLINPICESKTFLDSLYFSTSVFTTMGFGDFTPISWLRFIALLESFLGLISLGFLIAGYSNVKY
jgi:hypothetical protein